MTAAVDITVVDVVSREGIDKAPGRVGCCFNGSGADGSWVLMLVDAADICSPNAPTYGPEPIIVVCAATLVPETVAEALGWGVVVIDVFTSLEAEGPCTLAPFTGWC